jgi:hypothetical protein
MMNKQHTPQEVMQDLARYGIVVDLEEAAPAPIPADVEDTLARYGIAI